MSDLFELSKLNSEKYIENEYIEIWIYDGLLYAVYKPGVIIDLKVAEEAYNCRIKSSEGKSYAALCCVKNVKYWTKEARAYQNRKENYYLFLACAIIYSENIVANIIVNFYLKFTTPLIPSRFFSNEKKGYEWLQKYRYIEKSII
jgi:hypothetical protein